jgi:outer membrane protein TolC
MTRLPRHTGRPFILVALGVLLFPSVPVFPDGAGGTTETLGVRDIVRRVLEFDPSLATAERRAAEADERFILTRSAMIPDISVDIEPYGYDRRRVTAAGITEIAESHSAGLGLQITQSLPSSGRLSAGITHRFTVTDFGDSRSLEQVPEGTVGFSQPLFSTGSLLSTDVFDAAMREAELARMQSRLTVETQQNEAILRGVGQFVRYAGLRRTMELNRRTIAVLEEQIRSAELDRSQGILSENAVLALQVTLNDRRRTLFDMELEAVRTEQELVRLLNLAGGADAIREYRLLDIPDELTGPIGVTGRAVDGNNPLVRSRRMDVERARAQGLRNALTDRPQFDVSLSARPLYPEDRESSDDFSTSLSDYLDGEGDFSARISLLVRIPLLTGRERAARDSIDALTEAGAVASLEDTEGAVNRELEVLRVQRELLLQRRELLETELEYQRRRLRSEEDLLEAGATTRLRVQEVALDLAYREYEDWQVSTDLFLNGLNMYAVAGEELASILLR